MICMSPNIIAVLMGLGGTTVHGGNGPNAAPTRNKNCQDFNFKMPLSSHPEEKEDPLVNGCLHGIVEAVEFKRK